MKTISPVGNDPRFHNWFGNVTCHGSKIVIPETLDDLKDILSDCTRFPSPVRALGSRHSVTECMAAMGTSGQWGTAIDMTQLGKGREVEIDRQKSTATVRAGDTLLKVSEELAAKGLQLPVISEFGSLTMGAGACAATKQSSFFPKGSGQVASSVVAMKMVTCDGRDVHLSASDPDFDALRCSYGLFGVVYEATFQVVPLEYISIDYEGFRVEEFQARSANWPADDAAIFLYLFPSTGRVVAALKRRVQPDPSGVTKGRWRLKIRNWVWRKGMPVVPGFVEDVLIRKMLENARTRSVRVIDQIVDFEKEARKFTFSMWAFPRADFSRTLVDYFAFCKENQGTGLRNRMPDVSYLIAKDTNSLLSYSYDSDVWTLDPASPGKDARWGEFLTKFNDWSSQRGGTPLLNQTPNLQQAQIAKAFKHRLIDFRAARARFDPTDRFLNEYFRGLGV